MHGVMQWVIGAAAALAVAAIGQFGVCVRGAQPARPAPERTVARVAVQVPPVAPSTPHA